MFPEEFIISDDFLGKLKFKDFRNKKDNIKLLL